MCIRDRYNGKYYMLSSGCTGWDPNVAELAVADSIMGQWTTIGLSLIHILSIITKTQAFGLQI